MSEHRSMTYQPALDGLRAIAVTLVLLFHGGVSWMRGGYVGVSVFFTLSGYLITALLLTEHDRTGTVSVGNFFARRVKRLLPASLLCLVLVGLAAAAGVFENVSSLRRDMLGALLQVANWQKLLGTGSYADLTNATLGNVAPLEHYWSLAIEEQFYWVWPVVAVVLLGRVKSSVGRLRCLAAMTLAAGVAAPVIARVWGADAAYWSTPARAGEILVGATVAAALHRYRARPAVALPLSVAGLGAIVWAATTWSSSSGPAYDGWLPVFALATAAVIVGVQHQSVVRVVLASAPFVWIGSISYGLYLFHWPLFAALTSQHLGIDGFWLFAVRIAATVLLATASAVLLERPIRAWSPPPRRPLGLALAATAAVALTVIVVAEPTSSVVADVSAAPIVPVAGTLAPLEAITVPVPPAVPSSTVALGVTGAASSLAPASTAGTTTTTAVPPDGRAQALLAATPVPTPSRPVRILVVGDSTAEALAIGLVAWAADHPDVAQVSVAASPGCGFIRTGEIPTDGAVDFSGTCARVLDEELPQMADHLDPDVAVLMVTMRDVEDRIWSEEEGALDPFDARFRERLLGDYRALADRLVGAGIDHVVWVLAPHPISSFEGEQRKMRDPARYEVQFGVIEQVAAEHGVVTVLDLNGWMTDHDLLHDAELRPDGMHLTPAWARWVSEVYVAGGVVSASLG
jgi:peptidoglycan/LPS O-acetylase OafA/YrhL